MNTLTDKEIEDALAEEGNTPMSTERDHFNGLTPAEAERLAFLLEEMGEAQQAIGKILRHGYESSDPTKPAAERKTNRVALAEELGHVQYAIALLCRANDLNNSDSSRAFFAKQDSLNKWTHHQ